MKDYYVMLLQKVDGSLDLGTSAATTDLNQLARWMNGAQVQPGEKYVPFKLTKIEL